jgi:hypothetical protein
MAEKKPRVGAGIGKIDCPDCGQGHQARVLVGDENGQAVLVACLGCDPFFRCGHVAWRER